MFDICVLTKIQYLDIVQLLISDTDINQYQNTQSWNEHIMAHSYGDIPLDPYRREW